MAATLPGGGPDQAGLFTWTGGPAVPATATISIGLAADIQINANVDPDLGGELDLLRDGGISDPLDPNYDYNPGDLAGYNGRLQDYINAMDGPRIFDAGVELDPTDTLTGFAASSVSWLESRRQTATGDLEVQSVIVSRTAESLSNTTGVNIDELQGIDAITLDATNVGKLSGRIDELHRLAKLKKLSLNGHGLSGSLSSLGQCKDLEELCMRATSSRGRWSSCAAATCCAISTSTRTRM